MDKKTQGSDRPFFARFLEKSEMASVEGGGSFGQMCMQIYYINPKTGEGSSGDCDNDMAPPNPFGPPEVPHVRYRVT